METQKYQFSYIIVYKHTPDRLPLLRKTIAWLHQIPGAEIILVEMDKTSKLQESDHRARHYIFLEHEGPMEKTWGYNVGLKYATSDTIIYGDPDIIMNPNDFKKSLQEFKARKYDVLNPYKSIIDLEKMENNMNFDQLKTIKRTGRNTELLPGEMNHQKSPICGGISIWKKEAINKVGGWPEEFIGWGCADNAQSEKVFKLKLKHNTLNYTAYHLHHNRNAPPENLYFRNLNLFKQVKDMTDVQMINWINQNRNKNGNVSKHA